MHGIDSPTHPDDWPRGEIPDHMLECSSSYNPMQPYAKDPGQKASRVLCLVPHPRRWEEKLHFRPSLGWDACLVAC